MPGKLPDARYAALDAQYAKEQDALKLSEQPEAPIGKYGRMR